MLLYGIVCLLLPVIFVIYQFATDTLAPLSFYYSFDLISIVLVQISFTFTAIYFFSDVKDGIYKFVNDILKGLMASLVLATILTLNTDNGVTTLRAVDASDYYINIFLSLLATLHLIYGFLLIKRKDLPFRVARAKVIPKDEWESSVVVTGQLVVVSSIILFVPPLKMLTGTYIQYILLFIVILFMPYVLIAFDLLLKNNRFVLFNDQLIDSDEINLKSKVEIFETKSAHYEHINKEIRKLHGEEQWFKG